MEFVCPTCKVKLLKIQDNLSCKECGFQAQIMDEIFCFSNTDAFFGELTREQMTELARLAEISTWRKAVQEFLPEVNPGLISTIDHPNRLNGIFKAGLDAATVALDFGCGLGGVSAPLSEHCAKVVGLDACFQRLEFTRIRKVQDKLYNLILVLHDNPLCLPFAENTFDVVILNLVLPYLPGLFPGLSREDVEVAILKELKRVLRPGGRLYLAERNRASIYCFSRLMLPRTTRNSHKKEEYDRLLTNSGFTTPKYYWLIPDYKRPEHVIDLSAPYNQFSESLDSIKEFPKLKRSLFKVIGRIKPYCLAHTYGIVAQA